MNIYSLKGVDVLICIIKCQPKFLKTVLIIFDNRSKCNKYKSINNKYD